MAVKEITSSDGSDDDTVELQGSLSTLVMAIAFSILTEVVITLLLES